MQEATAAGPRDDISSCHPTRIARHQSPHALGGALPATRYDKWCSSVTLHAEMVALVELHEPAGDVELMQQCSASDATSSATRQVYVWGRRHQYVNLSFLGIFNFTAPYLPWVLLAFSVILGSSPVVDLLGMVAGAPMSQALFLNCS